MDGQKRISDLSIEKTPGKDTIFNGETYKASFVIKGIPADDSLTKLKFRFNDMLVLVSGDTGYLEFTATTRFTNDTLFEASYQMTAELESYHGLDTTLASDFNYYLSGLKEDVSKEE